MKEKRSKIQNGKENKKGRQVNKYWVGKKYFGVFQKFSFYFLN